MKKFLPIFAAILLLDQSLLDDGTDGSFGFNLRKNPVLQTSQDYDADEQSEYGAPITIHDFHINLKTLSQ